MITRFKSSFHKFFFSFVYGGHLLSLGASGVILTIILVLKLPFNGFVVLIPYLSTQLIYSYNHFRELSHDQVSNPERAAHISERLALTKFLLVLYTILLVIVAMLSNWGTLVFIMIMVLGGMLYTDYFKVRISTYVTGSKNLYSALFWALQIFLVPLFYETTLSWFYLCFFLILFLTAFINSIFFDIKDVESDKARDIKTFPVILGIKRTAYLLSLLKLLTIVPIVTAVYLESGTLVLLSFILFVFYGLYYLNKSVVLEGKPLRNLSYIVADGEYVLWPILIIVVKYLFSMQL